MPLSLPAIFRVLVVLAMGLHAFLMYCTARTLGESVGFHSATALGAAVFALLMMIPLMWAVTLPDWPEIYARFRGQRRWRAGRCPACCYPLRGIERPTCPECGAALAEPRAHVFGLKTIRRFAVITGVAWVAGVVLAEGWILADERAFLVEATGSLHAGALERSHERPRRWPCGRTWLRYEPGQGISASR